MRGASSSTRCASRVSSSQRPGPKPTTTISGTVAMYVSVRCIAIAVVRSAHSHVALDPGLGADYHLQPAGEHRLLKLLIGNTLDRRPAWLSHLQQGILAAKRRDNILRR